MVIWELEKALRDILKENAAFEAKEIIMSVCGMSTSDWIINRKAEVKEEYVNKALEMAHRRISGEPLQYIIGSKNRCVALLSKPGLWLQKLTTREPDDSQIEVAIASMIPCIPENKEDDRW